MRSFYALVVTLPLIACDGESVSNGSNLIVCTTEYVYGIRVNLNDSITGEPVSICNVAYSISDGEYVEINPAIVGDSCENQTFILGAGERNGVYDIHVEKMSYEIWENSDVIVNGNECHVEQVVLEAFLEPQN